MKKVSRDEWGRNYQSSRQSKAKNWEVAVLWHEMKEDTPKGIRGSFTALNRTPEGVEAVYPPITLESGTMEFFILDGEFRCNDAVLNKGDYALFDTRETMEWSSTKGGEMLIVLKGELTVHQ